MNVKPQSNFHTAMLTAHGEAKCLKFKRNKRISNNLFLSKFCFYQTFETAKRIILTLKEEVFLMYYKINEDSMCQGIFCNCSFHNII